MADCQRGHRHKVYNPPRRITIYFLYVVEQEAPFSLSLQFFSLLSLSTTNMSNVFSELCSKQFQTKKKHNSKTTDSKFSLPEIHVSVCRKNA